MPQNGVEIEFRANLFFGPWPILCPWVCEKVPDFN